PRSGGACCFCPRNIGQHAPRPSVPRKAAAVARSPDGCSGRTPSTRPMVMATDGTGCRVRFRETIAFTPTTGANSMASEISTLRLWLLRCMYALIAVGLGLTIWPLILSPPAAADEDSVIAALLGALAVMAALGLRYPLKMLPLLLFELLWKLLWIATSALPVWLGGGLDAYGIDTFFACLIGVVLVPLVVPWRHVRIHYLRAPGTPCGGPVLGAVPELRGRRRAPALRRVPDPTGPRPRC